MDRFDFESLEKSCVLVYAEYGDGDVSVGTGNIIYHDGYRALILTCGHNIEDYFDEEKKAKLSVEIGDEWFPALLMSTEVYAKREELGLLKCLVGGESRSVVKLSEPVLYKGMPLYMSSHVFANDRISNTRGYLSQPTVPGDSCGSTIRAFVEYVIDSGRGSSGAAVVDSLGRLVAVHVNAGMTNVDYNQQYKDPVKDYKLETSADIKYGIPKDGVWSMINELSASLPVGTTVERRLCHIATRVS